jgi:hypothetical protein
VDETTWLSATREHPTLFVSGLVDTATGRLLDVVEDRTARAVVRTLHRWEDEILAFHTTGGVTNARTEAANLGIKAIKRVGRGFRNFNNYRLRLLLACGGVNRQHQPAARLRGRRPHLAA